MASELQVKTNTIVLSGGYGRGAGGAPVYACNGGSCFTGTCNAVEMIDDSCTSVPAGSGWGDIDLTGSKTATYSYRDSNASNDMGGYGLNSASTRVAIQIRNDWKAKINDDATITIGVDTYLISLVRDNLTGISGLPGRNIFVYGMNGNNKVLKAQYLNNSIDANATLYSGSPLFLGHRDITLAPQETSYNEYTVYLHNKTVGRGDNIPPGVASIYADEMAMGVQFKNNLPNQLPAPKLLEIEQKENICENYVDAFLTFDEATITGAGLEVQWRYEGEDWSDRKDIKVSSPLGQKVTVTLNKLVPDTKVYFRARRIPLTTKMVASDWIYGDFKTLWIPPIPMTVPDITEQECLTIRRGGCIDKFDHVVYYNEELKQ